MNRSARIALVFGGLMLCFAAPALAQTSASTNLNVTATVNGNCSITTSAVAFGTYDPVVANATANLNGNGTVSVTCTKGAGSRIDLGLGSNASGSTRRMAAGGEYLTYELYKDSGRTQVWGTGSTDGNDIGAAPSRATRNITVYGQVLAGQDVAAGTYSDTVVATINF